MSRRMARQPPYARRTRHHPPPEARVILGEPGWELARLIDASGGFRCRFAVLPPDTAPSDLDWSAFSGCDVFVSYDGNRDRDQAAAAAVELVQAGARMGLTVDHIGNNPMDRYRPQVSEHG